MNRFLLVFLVVWLLPLLALAQADKALPSQPVEDVEVDLPSEQELMNQSVNIPGVLDITLHPDPNYSPCADPKDAQQLVDAQIGAAAYNAKGTVGWHHFDTLPDKHVVIDLKLRKITFITMVRFHLTGGRWAGAALPANIFISVSVDGKRWPLHLRYFPAPWTAKSEDGHPFAGWLLLTKIFQLGRYVKIEFEMGDHGDLLLLDEIQILGPERIFVMGRKDMDYWTEMQPDEEPITFGTKDLVQEGNLIINPSFVDVNDDGAPEGLRVESRDLSPRATADLSVENTEGANALVVKRLTDDGVVCLVLAALPAEAAEQKLVFSAEVMTTAGSSCSISVNGPTGSSIVASEDIDAQQWKTVSLSVAAAKVASGVTFAFQGKKGDVLRVRNVRLTTAD